MSNTQQQFLPKKVNAVLAVDQKTVDHNITTNLKNIPTWFGDIFYPNGFEAIIISAGPSMEKYVQQLNIKERMEDPKRDFVVFCVKHALPRLVQMGVHPDFCVILDGRPFEEDSTHGVERKSLFEEIPPSTIFMVASMSHPGYAKYLMLNGARTVGWHTSVDGIDKFRQSGQIREAILTGGTSSGTRCIGIANAMGIREITLLGFDSCILNPTKEELKSLDAKGRQKYLPIDLPVLRPATSSVEQQKMMDDLSLSFDAEGYVLQSTLLKRFFTTGELMAQAQDFESLLTAPNFDMKVTVLDDGILHHMYNNMENIPKRGFSFIEHMRTICPRKDYEKIPKRIIDIGNKE